MDDWTAWKASARPVSFLPADGQWAAVLTGRGGFDKGQKVLGQFLARLLIHSRVGSAEGQATRAEEAYMHEALRMGRTTGVCWPLTVGGQQRLLPSLTLLALPVLCMKTLRTLTRSLRLVDIYDCLKLLLFT